MFGWRRRSEGFEWREYVRTTVLVRRADRQRRIEDARLAAVEKVKNAADAGAEAGRASASFVGSQFSKLLSIIVEALLDFAAAAFHLVTRWSKFLFAVIADAFRTLAGRFGIAFGDALKRPVDAVRSKASLLPDIARRSPVKPRHIAGAAAAKSGLTHVVRGRRVTCTPSGSAQDASGYVSAQCTVGDADLAAELVRNGYVFAVSSFFSSLGSKEEAARSAKKGIWQGEIQRPQEWRDQQWQDAKRGAPDGCPIKGFVRASSKLYTLPWSADYDRAKVRTNRGERWFCSEDEAKAAGFQLSSRS